MTATTTYPHTREQAMGALSKANEVRTTNMLTIASIRRLRSKDKGLRAAARLLRNADMDAPIGAMPVYRLAFAPHYVREAAALKLLTAAGIYADKPIRRLSDRQREALADQMDAAATATAKRRR